MALTATAFDNAHLEKGRDVQDKFNDQLAGYEYVLDVATGRRPASQGWIKELHEVICSSQQTFRVWTGPESTWQDQSLPKGKYKSLPNNPMNLEDGRVHHYASPLDTPAEMARFVAELQSPDFGNAHPVLQAAFAHYAFVCIHPFADGNGRVSRALASTYLYRSPGIPLVIFADQKGAYIDALESADAGDVAAFVSLIRDCALDIIGMISQDVRRPQRPDPKARLERLKSALVPPQGLTRDEMQALTSRIGTTWRDTLRQALADLELEPLSLRIASRTGGMGVQDYRSQVSNEQLTLVGKSGPPAVAERTVAYTVLEAEKGSPTGQFTLFADHQRLADIALREVHPVVSTALKYRLRVVAEDQVHLMIDELVTLAHAYLEEHPLE